MELKTIISKVLKEYLNENVDGYLKWKRENVTLRGIKNEVGDFNNAMARFGNGLYTAPLSNRAMAKEYGKVYFVVNARPKNPKIFNNTNEAEIFCQKLVNEFCKKHGKGYDTDFFWKNTNIETEMLNLGFDGLIIKGREMVNYQPENIRYFEEERQLIHYYDSIVAPD